MMTGQTTDPFTIATQLTQLRNTIMDAFGGHSATSTHALESDAVRESLKAILLGPVKLYEALRQEA